MYIVYDACCHNLDYYDTEEQAVEALQYLIDQSIDGVEWENEVTNHFIAKITHEVKAKKVDAPEGYEGNIKNFYNMEIATADAHETVK